MKKIFFVIPIFFLMLSMISCEKKSVDDAALKSLRDSADKAWTIMIKSDDQKISDMTRLLQEISYCKKYNSLLLDSLTNVLKTMKDQRYNQVTMTSPEIDKYDAFTDKVISRMRFLGSNTEDLQEHPLAETLYVDIATADNDVVRYRTLYDKFARAYNEYLEKVSGQLGEKSKDYPKLPLFTLEIAS